MVLLVAGPFLAAIGGILAYLVATNNDYSLPDGSNRAGPREASYRSGANIGTSGEFNIQHPLHLSAKSKELNEALMLRKLFSDNKYSTSSECIIQKCSATENAPKTCAPLKTDDGEDIDRRIFATINTVSGETGNRSLTKECQGLILSEWFVLISSNCYNIIQSKTVVIAAGSNQNAKSSLHTPLSFKSIHIINNNISIQYYIVKLLNHFPYTESIPYIEQMVTNQTTDLRLNNMYHTVVIKTKDKVSPNIDIASENETVLCVNFTRGYHKYEQHKEECRVCETKETNGLEDVAGVSTLEFLIAKHDEQKQYYLKGVQVSAYCNCKNQRASSTSRCYHTHAFNILKTLEEAMENFGHPDAN